MRVINFKVKKKKEEKKSPTLNFKVEKAGTKLQDKKDW